jgi:hypothetical protein
MPVGCALLPTLPWLHFWCVVVVVDTGGKKRISNNKTKTLAYRLALAAEKAVVAGEFEDEHSFFRDNESWRSASTSLATTSPRTARSRVICSQQIHATRVLWRSLVPRHI